MSETDSSDGTNSGVRPRRPLLAAVLAFLVPGLGQLYNGQPRKAVVIYALGPALVLLSASADHIDRFQGLVAVILALVCIFTYALIDAVRHAKAQQNYLPRRYNAWYVYALLAAAAEFVLFPWFVSLLPVKSYRIPTGSMEQTVQIDDHIVVAVDAYREIGPERGDIIVYRYPMEPDREFLHRVVGLPGERLRIKDKRVFINDELLDEPYVFLYEPAPSQNTPFADRRRDNMPDTVIPDNHYFTMGDNRDNAHDSRFWGFLPVELVRGKALYVYWSHQWSRIGTSFHEGSR